MRKIIANKSYDTDTAVLVGEWNNREYGSFDYVAESLYRKRTGEYFLHGEGGARSRYAESHGNNSWGAGETITPLNIESAAEWAESHLTADAYESEFGEVAEGDKLTSLHLSTSAYKKLSLAAAKRGMSRSVIVELLINERL